MSKTVIARSAERSKVPEISLVITSNNVDFSPPVKDGVEIEWNRGGVPGKMTFTTIKVSKNGMNFFEGDKVCFYVNKELFFQGYVFKKQRNKNGEINVTCYDQLRYFKNKFSYVFTNKTATEIVKSLCNDFKLNVGELDDTKSPIPSITEENKEAWDVVLKALNETLTSTGKMYNLMDVQGKVTLKDSENMVCDTVITSDTAQDFDYTSSIDDETYTEIVLYYKPQTNVSNTTGDIITGTDDLSGTQSTDGTVTGGTVALNAMNWMIGIANDNSHGYSQANRWGPDYDCSSLTISAYEYAGVRMKVHGIYASGSMPDSNMRKAGFANVTSSCNMHTAAGMQQGDILWKAGHVAMYIGNGRLVEASSNRGHPQRGDQTGTEIKTDKFRSGFTKVFRYVG